MFASCVVNAVDDKQDDGKYAEHRELEQIPEVVQIFKEESDSVFYIPIRRITEVENRKQDRGAGKIADCGSLFENKKNKDNYAPYGEHCGNDTCGNVHEIESIVPFISIFYNFFYQLRRIVEVFKAFFDKIIFLECDSERTLDRKQYKNGNGEKDDRESKDVMPFHSLFGTRYDGIRLRVLRLDRLSVLVELRLTVLRLRVLIVLRLTVLIILRLLTILRLTILLRLSILVELRLLPVLRLSILLRLAILLSVLRLLRRYLLTILIILRLRVLLLGLRVLIVLRLLPVLRLRILIELRLSLRLFILNLGKLGCSDCAGNGFRLLLSLRFFLRRFLLFLPQRQR